MVDRKQPHQVQVHGLRGPQQQGPSASKVLAVLTMLPVGGGLLALAGITLVGTLIGLTVTTPLFILFSPVLVPAALLIGFAATSFLASGTLGLTGFRSLSWVASCVQGGYPDHAGEPGPGKEAHARHGRLCGTEDQESGPGNPEEGT